jgi:hypothetical protein
MNVPFQKDDLITRPKIIHRRLQNRKQNSFHIFPQLSLQGHIYYQLFTNLKTPTFTLHNVVDVFSSF